MLARFAGGPGRIIAVVGDGAETDGEISRCLLVGAERFDNERRAIALTGDRQGIGGSR